MGLIDKWAAALPWRHKEARMESKDGVEQPRPLPWDINERIWAAARNHEYVHKTKGPPGDYRSEVDGSLYCKVCKAYIPVRLGRGG